MTHCPYGDDALNKLLRISNDPNLFSEIKLRYIIYDLEDVERKNQSMNIVGAQSKEACSGSIPFVLPDENQKYYALHGNIEIAETKRRLILHEFYPDRIVLYISSWLNSNGDWRNSIKSIGLNPNEWEEEFLSERAEQLLSQNCKIVADSAISSSPTLIINGRVIPILRMSDEDLRRELCLAGILKRSCVGILCDDDRACPPKVGYSTVCKNGFCDYLRVEPGENAKTIYMITPKDCIICRRLNAVSLMTDFLDKVRFKEIDLEDSFAQSILKHAGIREFPVLAVKKDIIENEWGESFLARFKFNEVGDFFLLQLSDEELPYEVYGKNVRENDILSAQIDHSREALFLHMDGAFEEAASSYLLAIQKNNSDMRSLNNLGVILYEKGGWNETSKLIFEKCLEIDSRYIPSLQNLLSWHEKFSDKSISSKYKFRLALAKFREKNYLESEQLLRSIMETEDGRRDLEVRKALGYCLAKSNRPEEALSHLNWYANNADHDDISSSFFNLLGGVYYRLKLYADAENYYWKALKAEGSVTCLLNLAELLRVQQRMDDALTILFQGTNKWPNDLRIKMEMALIFIAKHDYKKAIDILNSLSNENAFALRCHFLLAEIYFNKKELPLFESNAHEFLNQVSTLDGSKFKNELLQMAEHLNEASLYSSAVKAYILILRWEPSNVVAHMGISVAYKNMGNLDKAEEHVKYMKQFGGSL